jgi:penicillin-binding protein 1A
MLAGLPKAPSAYNPIANPSGPRTGSVHHRPHVRQRLHHRAAHARPSPLRYRTPAATTLHAEFVAETARQLVFSQYGEEAYTRGLNVVPDRQCGRPDVAYRACAAACWTTNAQVYRGPRPMSTCPPTRPAGRPHRRSPGRPPRQRRPARRRGARGVTQARWWRCCSRARPSPSPATACAGDLGPGREGRRKKQIRRGAVVRRCERAEGRVDADPVPEVEGALRGAGPTQRRIRALVGGFDFNKSKFNHVTQAWRQPGSSFKPFIYSAALERASRPPRWSTTRRCSSTPAATGSQPWEPKNYDGKFDGPMPLRRRWPSRRTWSRSACCSPSAWPDTQEWVTRFGFDPADKHPAYLTMALGAGSVTPMQMAAPTRVRQRRLPRGAGADRPHRRRQPGKVLWPSAAAARRIHARDRRAQRLRDEQPAAGSDPLGHRAGAGHLKRPDLYGKTGTTNDSMDAWFAGFQPGLVAVVWIGYDNPRKLGDRETGGGLALPQPEAPHLRRLVAAGCAGAIRMCAAAIGTTSLKTLRPSWRKVLSRASGSLSSQRFMKPKLLRMLLLNCVASRCPALPSGSAAVAVFGRFHHARQCRRRRR